jgi:hypothetical protein
MGIVFVQNVTMLEVWSSILAWLEKVTGTTSYYVTFSITFIVAMLIPILLLGLASLVAQKFNGISLFENFTRFGYAIIALDMAGHIAHNLFHLLAEGKSIIFTGMALFGQTLGHDLNPAILDMGSIQMLQFGLIGLGLIGSLYTAYRIARASYAPEKLWGTFVPFAVLMVILGVINFYLFVLPMAMRM